MLNEKIRELRLLHGMSQVDLGKRLNVTKQCISNWENDNILPSVDMLIKLAKCFSVSTDYLLGLDEKEQLDVTGLSEQTIVHLRMLIEDMRK